MPDGVFNIAKGRVVEFHNRVNDSDPTNAELLVLLLETAEADSVLEDHATLSAILAGGNTEAGFTAYVRKFLTDLDITPPTYDTANNYTWVDIGDVTWLAAGGGVNETLAKAIICYDFDGNATGNDTTIVPMTHHDFTPTTNGNDLVLQISADGYFRAT